VFFAASQKGPMVKREILRISRVQTAAYRGRSRGRCHDDCCRAKIGLLLYVASVSAYSSNRFGYRDGGGAIRHHPGELSHVNASLGAANEWECMMALITDSSSHIIAV
jgi:hypothetical protein